MMKERAHRLVLIDGNAIIHRAYHALPPLTAPDGTLVNAVYGFTSMLMKTIQDLKPTRMAVAFDRPKPTFRKKLFADYQAKRPKMEEDLSSQIAKVHEIVDAFGIPIYEVDGFEADDVIGTLARKALNEQVVIVTGDRDMLQLVNDHTFVYMLIRGLSEAKLYDEKGVYDRLGVAPGKIPDLKALAGDASDNYPGVAGIGPKTAAALVAQFGSLEALYRAIRKKDPRVKTLAQTLLRRLSQGVKNATLSKELATIRTDVPLGVNLDDTPMTTLDTPKARSTLAQLNFASLLSRLDTIAKGKTGKRDSGKVAQKKTKTKEDTEQQLSLV